MYKRQSLGRVSVPVWLVVLSDQLQIVGLVSFYPTNYLICHRPLQSREARRSPAFILRSYAVLATLSSSYPPLLGTFRCITHPFATRQRSKLPVTVRLACVKHAASVQSEPGSNSSVQSLFVDSFESSALLPSRSLKILTVTSLLKQRLILCANI